MTRLKRKKVRKLEGKEARRLEGWMPDAGYWILDTGCSMLDAHRFAGVSAGKLRRSFAFRLYSFPVSWLSSLNLRRIKNNLQLSDICRLTSDR